MAHPLLRNTAPITEAIATNMKGITNANTGGQLTRHWLGGGGGDYHPPPQPSELSQ